MSNQIEEKLQALTEEVRGLRKTLETDVSGVNVDAVCDSIGVIRMASQRGLKRLKGCPAENDYLHAILVDILRQTDRLHRLISPLNT